MTYSEKNHPKPQWVIGYTSRYHLMLDLDNTTEVKAVWITKQIMKRYNKVGDALLVLSSTNAYTIALKYTILKTPYISRTDKSYHVIFDNNIGYNLCVQIVEMLAGLGIVERSFLFMRHFRGDMTLRVSPTIMTDHIKPRPRLIDYIENPYTDRRDHLIWEYLTLLSICDRLFTFQQYTKTQPDNSSNSTNNNTKQSTIQTVINSPNL